MTYRVSGPFQTVPSTAPSFNSTSGSLGLYALNSSNLNRFWRIPARRAVRLANASADDFSVDFGSSDVVATSTGGFLVLGGTAEIFGTTPSDSHISIKSSTDVVANVTLGHSGGAYAGKGDDLTEFHGAAFWHNLAEDKVLTGRVGGDITVTRASRARYFDSNGVSKIAEINEARFDHDPSTKESLGLLKEGARTNEALQGRDFTNAVWVADGITPAKNAVGIDNVANAASTLTATKANATILQALTLGATDYNFSIYVKRKTGSGTIEITDDDGSSFTALTDLKASESTRYDITQSQANPVVGIRIGTAGDEVIVDFVQLESGVYATSPIETFAAAVTRAKEAITFPDANFDVAQGAFYIRVKPLVASAGFFLLEGGAASIAGLTLSASGADRTRWLWRDGASRNDHQSFAQAEDIFVAGQTLSIAGAWDLTLANNDMTVAVKGGVITGTNSAVAQSDFDGTMNLARRHNDSANGDGHYSEIAVWHVRKPDSVLEDITI